MVALRLVALRLVALRRRSALAVLRSLTGLLQAVLLALDRTRVTLEEAGLFQDRTVIGVDLDERAGDRETQRTGLAGATAPVPGTTRPRTTASLRRPTV